MKEKIEVNMVEEMPDEYDDIANFIIHHCEDKEMAHNIPSRMKDLYIYFSEGIGDRPSWVCEIEFFKEGHSLGTYPLKMGSTPADRDAIVDDYDKYIIDCGRVTVWVRNGVTFALCENNSGQFSNITCYDNHGIIDTDKALERMNPTIYKKS